MTASLFDENNIDGGISATESANREKLRVCLRDSWLENAGAEAARSYTVRNASELATRSMERVYEAAASAGLRIVLIPLEEKPNG